MPHILYRYLLAEIVRTGLLTAVVLVTVIAFGAAFKPLANENLLSAVQTATYIVLAIVPMLQFALPFAAGFAATLVLHRFTTDNEVLAMAASGLSYRRILLPLLALGLALSAVMVLLTQSVIPRFWAVLENMIAHDLTRLFQTSIERGEPFVLDDLQIFAERIRVEHEPDGSEAQTRLHLWGVTAARVGDEGRIESDTTARRAAIDLYRTPEHTLLTLRMLDAVQYERGGALTRIADLRKENPIIVPRALSTEPRAMTRAQLLAMHADPMLYHTIRNFRRELVHDLDRQAVREAIRRQLTDHGRVRLVQPGSERVYEIHATSMSGDRVADADGGEVRIVRFSGDRPTVEFLADDIHLTWQPESGIGDGGVQLSMARATVTDLTTQQTNVRAQIPSVSGLQPIGLDLPALREMPLDDLLVHAEQRLPGSTERLVDRMERLDDEITGRLAKRYALSSTAMLLLCLGAVLAMLMRHTQPLTIYLLAFLPSVLDLIIISGGEQMVRSGAVTSGLAVMWSGNAALALLGLAALWRLSRN